ncbi:MAG: arsenate reductase ArsC [Candidatus Saganbacteria bacterium]|nr:arsenate reductase ArsC [Candidatus Saganbacteria bacterium]
MKKVLFICTGNSCRSQMAEGLLRDMAGDRFEVFSAGVSPSSVHPLAIEAMKEAGIDITGHESKDVSKVLGRKFDYVITVCDHAKQMCPFVPGGHKKIHWSTEDPVGLGIAEFLKVRDKLKKNIEKFLAQEAKESSEKLQKN